MAAAVTNSDSKSPFWKMFVPAKRPSIHKKKKPDKNRVVTFSDHDPTELAADISLTQEDEDALWWTDEELELIMFEAQSSGDLESFKESIRRAQLQIAQVLKEQERQRKNGMLGSDWKSTAKVSRRGSSDAQRLARTTGLETAKTVSGSPVSPTVFQNRPAFVKVPSFRGKSWLKVGPAAG